MQTSVCSFFKKKDTHKKIMWFYFEKDKFKTKIIHKENEIQGYVLTVSDYLAAAKQLDNSKLDFPFTHPQFFVERVFFCRCYWVCWPHFAKYCHVHNISPNDKYKYCVWQNSTGTLTNIVLSLTLWQYYHVPLDDVKSNILTKRRQIKWETKRTWLLLQIEFEETVLFKVTSRQMLHFFPVICTVILTHSSLVIPYSTQGSIASDPWQQVAPPPWLLHLF